MSRVTYRLVEHDGGWAYKAGDVFSETYPTKNLARQAASRAAEEQRTPGEDVTIEYEDGAYRWHDEEEKGSDRPETDVAG